MKRFSEWVPIGGLFLLIVIVSRATLGLVQLPNTGAPLWPASGIGLVLVYRYGLKTLPLVFLGNLLGTLDFSTEHVWVYAISCFGNALEAWVGRMILLRLRDRHKYGILSESFSIFSATFVSAIVSALIGIGAWVGGGLIPVELFVQNAGVWWAGNLVGSLVVTPCLLSVYEVPIPWKEITLRQLMTGLLLTILAALMCYFVLFFEDGRSYLFCLFILYIFWNGLISREAGKYLTLVIAAAAMISISRSIGPFSQPHFRSNLILLEVFLATVSLTAITLSEFYSQRLSRIPLIILMCGWILAGVLFFYLTNSQAEKDSERLTYLIRDTENQIRLRLWGNEDALWSGASLFAASDDVTRDEWGHFVTTLNLTQRYSGFFGVGAIQKNPEKDYFEPATNWPLYESLKNSYSWGHALERSKSSGIAAFSDPIYVPGESEGQNFLVLALPMFWQSSPETFRGWVFSAFSPDKFFEGFKKEISQEIEFVVFFNRVNSLKTLVYSNFPIASEELLKTDFLDLQMERKTKLHIGQKTWWLGWRKSNSFVSAYDSTVAWFAAIGALFALMVATVIYILQNLESRANELAMSMTRQIRLEQDERLKVERSMEEHRQKLIETSKMSSLGEMAGGIAHEINNPLTIINAKADLISRLVAEREIDSARVIVAAKKIEETVMRIAKIIRGLRTFARSAEGDPMLPMRLSSIIENSLELCQERFRYRGIDLRVERVPDVEVLCRETQIAQVLVNLLNNSFDAVLTNFEKWVNVSFERPNPSQVVIAVTDSGIGLPMDIADKVMQPFFTTKGVGKGTGLGLSISKGIIEEHGGTLTLDRYSPHTRFVITLNVTTHLNP